MPTLRPADVLVPAGLALLAVVELAALDADGRLAAGAVIVLACAVLVARRALPLVAGTTVIVLCAVPPWLGPAIEDVATPILVIAAASYALARWLPDLRGIAGLVLGLGVFGVDYLTVDTRDHDVTDVVFLLSLLTPPYVFGRVVRRLADHQDVLRREQELLREAALREERERIARELHDVMAHSVSAMVVQIAVAQDLVATDPVRAGEVLESAAGTGRRALAETGRLLHTIRDSTDELGLAPAPGLVDVPALVAEHRTRGLGVDLSLPDPLPDLPAAVDVSAYRVVAEALTNAERYADGPLDLVVGLDHGVLRIRATNASAGRTGAGSGLGLAGMAERVGLLGGRIEHGVRGRTHVLEVDLPVDPAREPV